jgi:hypothetical protein
VPSYNESPYNDIELGLEFLLIGISGRVRRLKFKGMVCKIFYVAVILFLGGCVTAPREPVMTATNLAAVEKQLVITGLLAQAERDVLADRLMSPYGNNAYDRFQGVLKLQPENAQAKSGLQLIILRYVTLAREALKRDKPARAKTLLAAAQRINGQNPLLSELQAAVDETISRQARLKGMDSDNEFILSRRDLNVRSDALKSLLRSLAQRIQQSDESVLIVARNDLEGRWLYQQLRLAATGYRVRGNIRVAAEPKIVLLPPL